MFYLDPSACSCWPHVHACERRGASRRRSRCGPTWGACMRGKSNVGPHVKLAEECGWGMSGHNKRERPDASITLDIWALGIPNGITKIIFMIDHSYIQALNHLQTVK